MSEWRVKILDPEPNDPFNTTELSVVDIGHSEKVIIVDGALIQRDRKRASDILRKYARETLFYKAKRGEVFTYYRCLMDIVEKIEKGG